LKRKLFIGVIVFALLVGIAALVYGFAYPTTANSEPPLRVVGGSGGGPMTTDLVSIGGVAVTNPLGLRLLDGSGVAIDSTVYGGSTGLDININSINGGLWDTSTNGDPFVTLRDDSGNLIGSTHNSFDTNYSIHNMITGYSGVGSSAVRIDALSYGVGIFGLASMLVNPSGGTFGSPTNIFWTGIGGYPSSAENVFENSNAKPVFTHKSGATYTGTVTGNGTNTVYSSGNPKFVTNVVISTESTVGTVVVQYSGSGGVIAKLYCTVNNIINTGEIRQSGGTTESIDVVRAGFSGAEEVFYSVTLND